MPTKIEWTDETWNPITGCSKISEGCANCYAARMAKRLAGRYGYSKDDPFKFTFHPDKINRPLRWKKPRRIFVCSMGDLFHEDVEDWALDMVFKRICYVVNSHHTFIVLTKRPERMLEYTSRKHIACFLSRKPNVIGMVTVENQEMADERIPFLLKSPFAIKGISIEPMLSEINLEMALEDFQPLNPDFSKKPSPIQWVICGGESGPGARPMHPDWVRSVRDQCQSVGVPFFFKQWGEWAANGHGRWIAVKGKKGGRNSLPGYRQSMFRVGKKKAGRALDGRTWNEYPACLNT